MTGIQLHKTSALGKLRDGFVDELGLASLERFEDGSNCHCSIESEVLSDVFFGSAGSCSAPAVSGFVFGFFHNDEIFYIFVPNLQEGGSGSQTASLLLDLERNFEGHSKFPKFNNDFEAHFLTLLEVFPFFSRHQDLSVASLIRLHYKYSDYS